MLLPLERPLHSFLLNSHPSFKTQFNPHFLSKGFLVHLANRSTTFCSALPQHIIRSTKGHIVGPPGPAKGQRAERGFLEEDSFKLGLKRCGGCERGEKNSEKSILGRGNCVCKGQESRESLVDWRRSSPRQGDFPDHSSQMASAILQLHPLCGFSSLSDNYLIHCFISCLCPQLKS